MLIVLWAPAIKPVPPLDLELQGSIGVPLRVGGVPRVGMYRLVPNWWVQSGAGSVRARALHCQFTTQQWYCITATLM